MSKIFEINGADSRKDFISYVVFVVAFIVVPAGYVFADTYGITPQPPSSFVLACIRAYMLSQMYPTRSVSRKQIQPSGPSSPSECTLEKSLCFASCSSPPACAASAPPVTPCWCWCRTSCRLLLLTSPTSFLLSRRSRFLNSFNPSPGPSSTAPSWRTSSSPLPFPPVSIFCVDPPDSFL